MAVSIDSVAHSSSQLTAAFAGVTNTFRGRVDDLYDLFRRKRAENPVMRGDILADIGIPSRAAAADGSRPVVSLFRFNDVQSVLRDGETFSSGLLLEHLGKFLGRLITGLDGAEHRAVRSLFQPAFSPMALAHWRSSIMDPVASSLLDRIVTAGRGELFGDLFIPFPMQAIYLIIGFPDDREAIDRFAAQALSILCGVQVETDRIVEARQAAMNAAKEIIANATNIATLRRNRAEPRADVISSLVRAQFEGQALTDPQIAQFVLSLLPAAAETTTRTLSNLFTLLLTHPEQLELVRNDRTYVQRAIGEAVRFEPVPMYLARQATREVTIDDVDIPKGAGITLVIGSANRDETQWSHADHFDITRKVKASLGFGHGIHTCLGMTVARAEMEVMVNAILDRLPNVRLDPAKPRPRIQGAHFRGPESIPVVWDV